MGFGFEMVLNALMILYDDPVLFAYYFKIPGEFKGAEQPFQIVIGQDAGYRSAGSPFIGGLDGDPILFPDDLHQLRQWGIVQKQAAIFPGQTAVGLYGPFI